MNFEYLTWFGGKWYQPILTSTYEDRLMSKLGKHRYWVVSINDIDTSLMSVDEIRLLITLL